MPPLRAGPYSVPVVSPSLVTLLALAAAAAARPQDAAPPGPTHIGAPAGTLQNLARPTDVAFDASGALWVLNGAGATASRHAPDGEALLARVGATYALTPVAPPEPAPGPAQDAAPASVARPSGLAAGGGDPARLLWCDAERHRVVPSLGPDLAVRGSGPRQVFAPEGLALDTARGLVAVADAGNRRVLVLALAGDRAPVVIADTRLVRPVDVGFLPESEALPGGGLAVLDADASRVELFDLAGVWRGGFGDWGYFPGLFAAPQGLATWRDEVFVADTDNHRVQVFAPKSGAALEYELRYTFGVHAIRPGEGDGSLHYPTDVAVAPDGSFAAVAEPLDGRVQLFRRAPGAEPAVDPLRVGIGQASAHYGRVMDIDGQFMALAEPESRRVLLFDLRLDEPVEIGALGGHGRRLGMLMRPSGLALDAAQKELLVADAALRRIARVRLAIDPAETLRFHPARETWVEALEFGRLGAGVLGDEARPIEPWEVDAVPAARGSRLPGSRGAVLVDGANGRVLFLGPDLAPMRVVFAAADGAVAPADVAVTRDGAHAWIADPGAEALFRVALEEGAQDVRRVPLRAPVRPMHVSVAPDGRVLVSDVLTHRLRVVADRDGALAEVTPIGAAPEPDSGQRDLAWRLNRGLGPLWFCEPADLGVDGRGRLVIIDHGNHRGVVLGPDGDVALGFGSRMYTDPLRASGGR